MEQRRYDDFVINKSESSIYPPDIKLLKIFDEKHWKNRQTAEVVKTKTTTLDLETKNHKFNPDFIKIDTQGAEYEILEGSKDTLKKGIWFVVRNLVISVS